MTNGGEGFLSACRVDDDVFDLRPDYRAMLVVVGGLRPGRRGGAVDGDTSHDGDRDDGASGAEVRSDHAFGAAGSGVADELVAQAEAHACSLLADTAIEDLPHIAAWRDAYRAFGSKPQRTRNSLEALTRRAATGLPRINALTDIYNAISVLHQIPLGGEDVDHYRGGAHLVRAVGDEDFDTVDRGEPIIDHPAVGEVVWRDDAGVTCRRWNWRQGRRTRLTDDTTTALFILDALAPVSDAELAAATDRLVEALFALAETASGVTASTRLLRPVV